MRPDVLVVGGGILGVATAVACRDAGLGSVTLIEMDRLGTAATGGAAGLLQPEPHHGSDPDELVELGRSSLRRWREIEMTCSGGVGLIDSDWIGLAPHPEPFMTNPASTLRWLNAGEVSGLIPDLGIETTGAFIPNQARLNPLRALARLAMTLPHVASRTPAVSVIITGGKITSVSTTAGTFTPGAVVFATGTPPKVDGLDLAIPYDTVKGHLMVTKPTDVRLPAMVAPIGVPLQDGRILVGGTLDIDDVNPDVRPEVINSLLSSLVTFLPSLAGIAAENSWTCFRPHHPDDLPVIDRLPDVTNGWITSGHYRTGILMAPATADLLANWISTQHPPPQALPWSTKRFTNGDP